MPPWQLHLLMPFSQRSKLTSFLTDGYWICRPRATSAQVGQRDVDQAFEAAEVAAWRMARMTPSTVAGAAALLAYITIMPLTSLFELGETAWHASERVLETSKENLETG
jgi:hypothetical protein